MTKAVDLCFALADAGGAPMRLIDLATATSMHRPTVLRVLGELIPRGIVVRTESGKYRLGPAISWMAQSATADAGLVEFVRPVLTDLAESTGMMVNLQVLTRDHTHVLDSVRPPRYTQVRSYVGDLLPVHRAAGALVQVAALPQARWEAYLAAARGAGLREGDEHKVVMALHEAARTRLYYRDGGLHSVISALATPVLTAAQAPVCALTVVGISAEFDAVRRQQAGEMLRKAAASLSSSVEKMTHIGPAGRPISPA